MARGEVFRGENVGEQRRRVKKGEDVVLAKEGTEKEMRKNGL